MRSDPLSKTYFAKWVQVVFRHECDRVMGSVLRVGPALIYSVFTLSQNFFDSNYSNKYFEYGESNKAITAMYFTFLSLLLVSLFYLLWLLSKELKWIIQLYLVPFEKHPLITPLVNYSSYLRKNLRDLLVCIDNELKAVHSFCYDLSETKDAYQVFLTYYWLIKIDLRKVVTGYVDGKLLTSAGIEITRLCEVEYMILFPLNTIVMATRTAGPNLSLIIIYGKEGMWHDMLMRSAELRRAASTFPTHMQAAIRALLGLSHPNPNSRPSPDMVAQSLRFMSLWMRIMDRLSIEVRTRYDEQNGMLTERLRLVMSSLEASSGNSSQAASDEAVAQLEEFSISMSKGVELQGTRCSMCLEDFQMGDSVTIFGCKIHMFHTECLKQWLIRQHTCPLCRYQLPVKQHPLPAEYLLEEIPDVPIHPPPNVPEVPGDTEQILAMRAADPSNPTFSNEDDINDPLNALAHVYNRLVAEMAVINNTRRQMSAVPNRPTQRVPYTGIHTSPDFAQLMSSWAHSDITTSPIIPRPSSSSGSTVQDPTAWLYEPPPPQTQDPNQWLALNLLEAVTVQYGIDTPALNVLRVAANPTITDQEEDDENLDDDVEEILIPHLARHFYPNLFPTTRNDITDLHNDWVLQTHLDNIPRALQHERQQQTDTTWYSTWSQTSENHENNLYSMTENPSNQDTTTEPIVTLDQPQTQQLPTDMDPNPDVVESQNEIELHNNC